jgi:hypothetical protein
MKRIFLGVIVVLIAVPSAGTAKLGASLANGITMTIETYTEPPVTGPVAEGGVLVNKMVQRYLIDRAAGTYFGYDLDADRLPDGAYRVYIRPLTARPQDVSRGHSGPPTLKLAPIPSYPEPQIVRNGEVILLPVMESPRTGHRLIDRIAITTSSSSGPAFPADKEPRDLTLLDVALILEEPVLLKNGTPVDVARSRSGSIAGPIVWFYVPGRGRLLLSAVPHASWGFTRAGVIQDNRITFTSGGDSYVCRSKHSILGSDTAWNLYLLHEPGYRPAKDDGSGYQFGSADRVEYLVQRR